MLFNGKYMQIQEKTIAVKKLGWKRVCKNTQRFGWKLQDAVQEERTSVTTSYEGRVSGDHVYIDEHNSSTTKIIMHLFFYRNRDAFSNISSIFVLELIYNLVFLVRRIIGFLLPLLTIGVVLIAALGESEWLFKETNYGTLWGVAVLIWLVLIITENVLSIVASKILRLK